VLFALLLMVGCASPAPISGLPADPETQTTQDLWIVSPTDLLQGRFQTGTHYALHAPFTDVKVSPDGRRVLLFVSDTSRFRLTYPAWIEVLDFATQKRWRLTAQSDWWAADWLPDGRILLVGNRVWLSDPAAESLQDLGETGTPIGGAFDGKQQVAWPTRFRPPSSEMTNRFKVHVFNLGSGRQTEYPTEYHTRVSPHSGAPMVFSPSGDRLAFVDKAQEKAHLVILDVASGEQTQFDVDASADTAFWDRRGLWVRRRAGDGWTTVRLDEQGREVQTIPESSPSVSPDDRWTLTSRSTEGSVTQPGLVDLETGEIHWPEVNGYYPRGWTAGGEMVLVQALSAPVAGRADPGSDRPLTFDHGQEMDTPAFSPAPQRVSAGTIQESEQWRQVHAMRGAHSAWMDGEGQEDGFWEPFFVWTGSNPEHPVIETYLLNGGGRWHVAYDCPRSIGVLTITGIDDTGMLVTFTSTSGVTGTFHLLSHVWRFE
jgi:hypothetical protein